MFQTIDTALAFAVIMLLLSLLITVFVQTVASILGHRGRDLAWAVAELLKRMDPKAHQAMAAERAPTDKEKADALRNVGLETKAQARELLSDPILAPARNGLRWIVILARNAVRKSRGKPPLPTLRRPPTEISLEDLALLLKYHEIKVGGESVKNMTVGDIKKKIGDWYNVVMTSATSRYKLRSRWVTVLGAFIVAFLFQVNSLEIFDGLSDNATRATVIGQLDAVDSLFAKVVRDNQTGQQAADSINAIMDRIGTEVLELDFMTLWPPQDSTWSQTVDKAWEETRDGVPGKMMTLLLLSLGAPFWYGAIGKLVGFRSALKPAEPAKKVEAGEGEETTKDESERS